MTRDERRGMRVLAITERVGFPRVRELVCISAGVSVDNAPDRIILGDVRVEARITVADLPGGAWGLGAGGGAAGCVTTPVGE